MPPVSHRKHASYELRNCFGTQMRTCLSVKLQSGGVVNFYSATNRHSRAASWSIFAPPRTPLLLIGLPASIVTFDNEPIQAIEVDEVSS